MSGIPPGVVVVTGATSGVGRAVVRDFAERGAPLALVARSDEALESTLFDVERLGGKGLAVPTDVADPVQVEEAARRIEADLGAIGVWVNNAMTTVFSPFMEYASDEYQRVTEVTYLATVWGTQAALRRMIPRNRGAIIQVGSALAYRGIPYQSAYCGAKHAIKGFTESIRTELLHTGSKIHVGMVQLPAVNTPQFSHCRSRFDSHPMPVPPIYQPEVAARGVRLAIEKRRREVYVGFPTVKTIVGNKVAPGFIDRYLARQGPASQLIDLPPSSHNREGNLFDTVPGDPGAHGIFDAKSRSFSPVLWMSENRVPLTLGAVGVGMASMLLSRRA